MEGTELTKQECESKLYDDFDRFTSEKGESIHSYYLRFAKWCAASPLSSIISSRDIFRAGWNLSTKVRDLIHEGNWHWPNDWTTKYPLLCDIPVPMISNEKCDYLEWRDNDGVGKPFSVYHVWNSISPRDNVVPWADFVWFCNCIPRHAFNMWLIIKKRLKTQDSLCVWDVAVGHSTMSSLCETQPDSHEHLFFECAFSQQIWMHLKKFAGLSNSGYTFDSILTLLLPVAKRKASKSTIGKLVIAAVAYFIWKERNRRLFKNTKRSAKDVIECVMSSV
ncbi:reverse transcriptase domain, reverse transcriptase zinc-binding domain protein [Tanacetum coccineum]